MTRISHSLRDVVSLAPTNAWLLMGDEASMPTPEELRRSRTTWREECIWTGPKQVQPGDLLFFYFMAPTKAIRFIARAATYPIFDPHEGVNSVKPVDPNQWWLNHTPLVPVTPVPFAVLQRLHDGYLNLRGKPSHYLPPDVVAHLLQAAQPVEPASQLDRAVLQMPMGDPLLPDPGQMTRRVWAAIADGPLKLERQVEQYVVEPLLRLALPAEEDVSWQKAYRIKGGVPDYVVLRGGVPCGVVEVKLGVREPLTDGWGTSPDFLQVTRYSELLDVPAVLVDSNRIFLINRKATAPSLTLQRKAVTDHDLRLVGEHLSEGRPRLL